MLFLPFAGVHSPPLPSCAKTALKRDDTHLSAHGLLNHLLQHVIPAGAGVRLAALDQRRRRSVSAGVCGVPSGASAAGGQPGVDEPSPAGRAAARLHRRRRRRRRSSRGGGGRPPALVVVVVVVVPARGPSARVGGGRAAGRQRRRRGRLAH